MESNPRSLGVMHDQDRRGHSYPLSRICQCELQHSLVKQVCNHINSNSCLLYKLCLGKNGHEQKSIQDSRTT